MAFCLFVVFIAGLFAVTMRNLSTRPLGFEPDGLAVLEINVTGEKQSAQVWADVGDRIRAMPGVEAASFAMWVPLKIGRAHVELQSPCNLVCRLLLEKKK